MVALLPVDWPGRLWLGGGVAAGRLRVRLAMMRRAGFGDCRRGGGDDGGAAGWVGCPRTEHVGLNPPKIIAPVRVITGAVVVHSQGVR